MTKAYRPFCMSNMNYLIDSLLLPLKTEHDFHPPLPNILKLMSWNVTFQLGLNDDTQAHFERPPPTRTLHITYIHSTP